MKTVFQEIAPGVFVPTAEQPPERADPMREAREVAARVIDGFGALDNLIQAGRFTVRQQLRQAEREANQHAEALREVKRCLRRRTK